MDGKHDRHDERDKAAAAFPMGFCEFRADGIPPEAGPSGIPADPLEEIFGPERARTHASRHPDFVFAPRHGALVARLRALAAPLSLAAACLALGVTLARPVSPPSAPVPAGTALAAAEEAAAEPARERAIRDAASRVEQAGAALDAERTRHAGTLAQLKEALALAEEAKNRAAALEARLAGSDAGKEEGKEALRAAEAKIAELTRSVQEAERAKGETERRLAELQTALDTARKELASAVALSADHMKRADAATRGATEAGERLAKLEAQLASTLERAETAEAKAKALAAAQAPAIFSPAPAVASTRPVAAEPPAPVPAAKGEAALPAAPAGRKAPPPFKTEFKVHQALIDWPKIPGATGYRVRLDGGAPVEVESSAWTVDLKNLAWGRAHVVTVEPRGDGEALVGSVLFDRPLSGIEVASVLSARPGAEVDLSAVKVVGLYGEGLRRKVGTARWEVVSGDAKLDGRLLTLPARTGEVLLACSLAEGGVTKRAEVKIKVGKPRRKKTPPPEEAMTGPAMRLAPRPRAAEPAPNGAALRALAGKMRRPAPVPAEPAPPASAASFDPAR